MPPDSPKVFISYSHDSEQHKASILALADRLCREGLDCTIDQYINGFPPEGWQRWMETQIENADFVLVVCTPLYLKRYRGLDDDGGRGVTFEGVVISQTLYDAYYRNTKFVPVLPDDGDFDNVPLPLKGFSAFKVSADYEGFYRYLTGQAAVTKPDVGERVKLKPNKNQPNKPINNKPTRTDNLTQPRGVKTITDTMKAALIGGVFVLLGAIITGLFVLWTAPNDTPPGNTTHGDSSPIITGNGNKVINGEAEK